MRGVSCLPHPEQIWSHGTNSFAEFSEAIQNAAITAIEADIVMGRDISSPFADSDVAIMAHPPIFESDLSVAMFLDQATRGNGSRTLTKHLKLDFKEFRAVGPTLESFKSLNVDGNGKTVFLNADVLEGPGKSSSDVTVPADEFVLKCLQIILADNATTNYAFSLGFKVEVHSPYGHTHEHLARMASLVKRHDLTTRCAGVVLAINARLLYKNTIPFQMFLSEFPTTQILVWTGNTEPPISSRKLNSIRNRFIASGHSDRVGYDCNVAKSLLHGLLWDLLVDVYGRYVFICKFFGITSLSASYSKPKKEA